MSKPTETQQLTMLTMLLILLVITLLTSGGLRYRRRLRRDM
jgi:hypothetical protein